MVHNEKLPTNFVSHLTGFAILISNFHFLLLDDLVEIDNYVISEINLTLFSETSK